jgi:hypothetical protein
LAAANAQAGRTDEAKAALAEARRLNPKLTVKWMIEHTSCIPAVLDGLRKAGLPEESSNLKAACGRGWRCSSMWPRGETTPAPLALDRGYEAEITVFLRGTPK